MIDYGCDFSKFSPSEYLREYYSSLNDENIFLLEAFHKLYLNISENGFSYLEVGGGPTIYQLISASRVVNNIIFTDLCFSNLVEVKRWLYRSSFGFDWSKYFEYVGKLEGVDSFIVEARLRSRLFTFRNIDIFNKINFNADIVASNFCIESIVDNEEEFLYLLNNCKSVCNKYLVLSLLKNATHYNVLEGRFSAFSLDFDYIVSKLTDFDIVFSDIFNCDSGRGYDGFIVLLAVRRG